MENPELIMTDINKIVSDSQKQNFTGEKRRRGRPLGTKKKITVDMPQSASVNPSPSALGSPEANLLGEASINTASVGEAELASIPSMDIPETALVACLQFPFNILKSKTGFDGFNMSEEKAKECAPLLNVIINQYLPSVDAKHMPAIILAGTLSTMLLNQSMEYSVWKRQHVDNIKPKTQEKPRSESDLAPIPEPKTADEAATMFQARKTASLMFQ